ncbi:MAG: 4-(cytidine 5'-diphospho)-2-C-methyl-D-erythritol kinase [Actinomycetota bacterium]|nr:4-(cytidine 5'-diphospho)-2-C-methyl-D-erythritol kinase [Actinomycetota bacterium]
MIVPKTGSAGPVVPKKGSAQPVVVPKKGSAQPVVVRVPAKINLHLSVGPPRPDGFHDLITVFLAVSLYDQVTAAPGEGLSLSVRGEGAVTVPLDDGNLVWRAAVALAEYAGVPADASLEVVKEIPVAAGLAGGSADAAAALVACDELWGTALGRVELVELAAGLGSDVAFLLGGGMSLGTGRGELLTPVLATGDWHWVLAFADGQLSATEVYAELDRLRGEQRPPPRPPDRLINGLRVRDSRAVAGALVNDLQPAALSLRPALRATLREGDHLGAQAGIVSGSGPTCAFLVASSRAAVRLAAALAAAGVCRTVRIVHGPVPGARRTTTRPAGAG